MMSNPKLIIMNKLNGRIKETKKLLRDYDMMPHEPDSDELIMKNQIAIMETLKDIQHEIGRIKKQPSPGGTVG